jgi:tRNA dimethylallyltransferase
MSIKVIHSPKNPSKKVEKPKVLVILGPTASGKTSLAVKLAEKLSGEIVSADSRQVYRGMDVGTGKDLKEYKVKGKNIPYHLIDVARPMEEFNIAKYQKLALKAIEDILKRGKLPIIAGGSGLYLQALVDGYALVPSKPDLKKRQELEALTVSELFNRLKKNKPDFAANLNNSDKNNGRRLVRYLEIAESGSNKKPTKKKLPYEFLVIGLQIDDDKMRERIYKRIVERLDNEDMIGEVERFLEDGVSSTWLNSLGLEYRHITWYLQDKISYDEMIEKLALATYRFAKRQKTWFRRWEKQGRDINWLEQDNKLKEATDLVKKWLVKS